MEAGTQPLTDRERLAARACAAVDASLTRPAVVIGSPPPGGRDLDVLAPRAELERLRAELARLGFAVCGNALACFDVGAGYEVELLAAEDWRLPPPELEALVAEGRRLAGHQRLLVPSPHHRLLILATRLGGAAGLPAGRRTLVAQALSADPRAWERARSRIAAWGAARQLDDLRRAFEQGGGRRAAPRGVLRTFARVVRRSPRRPIVALSGIDGAGKSSHAAALRAAMADVGIELETGWTPVASNRRLNSVANAVKGLQRRLPSRSSSQAGGVATEEAGSVLAGSPLRRRSRTFNYLWACIVALANAGSHLSLALRARSAGRGIVFDRYELDSLARLGLLYGEDKRMPRLIVRLLSPRPTAAFFLDLAPEESLARKTDVWNLEELQRHAALYREEARGLGARRLDASRPFAELAREIALEAWRSAGAAAGRC